MRRKKNNAQQIVKVYQSAKGCLRLERSCPYRTQVLQKSDFYW